MRTPLRAVRYAAVIATAGTIACGGGTQRADDGRTAAAPSAAWSATVQPLTLPVTGTTAEPQLTASPRGVILSWLEHTGDRVALKFSERINGAWSAPVTVGASDKWFVSWADVPAVMRMSNGTLVASFYPATDPLIEAYDLRLAYSRDDGHTWSQPITPHHVATRTQHGFASLFELPDNSLGLVWLDGRDQEVNTTDPEGGSMALYYARFDSGWKQTAEAAVNPRVCECCPTATAVTADGVLSGFRDRSEKEIRDIHVTRLEGSSWTPATPVHADNWEIDACPVNGPALSARGRNVAAAWFTAAGGKGQTLAAFSSDAGRTWGNPVALNEGMPRGYVDVEILDDGSAIATWVELGDDRSRVRMRRIEPSGARSAAVDIDAGSGNISGYPRVARAGTDLVFAWTDAGGNGEEGSAVRGALVRLP